MATKSTSFQQTLDAETKTSDLLDTRLYANSSGGSAFTLSIAGTFVATLHLLMSPDAGSTWIEYTRFEAEDVFHVPHAPSALWKLDCSDDGDYTSGSIFIEFARGSSGLSGIRLLTKDRQFVDEDHPLFLTFGKAKTWLARQELLLDGTSQHLVEARSERKGLIVQNPSGNNIIDIDPAGGAVTANMAWTIVGGDPPVRFLAPDCPLGIVTVIGSIGETVVFWELV